MNALIKFLVRPVYRKYQDLQFRISNLETVVDCMIDRPRWVDSEETGFNGQRYRKLIFKDLLKAFEFDAIIETGTWIGNTTGFLAKTSNLPVYTCELNKRFASLAKMRLHDISNITFAEGDSRVFLEQISTAGASKIKLPFFYLDAHWYEDLPLQEELEIICGGWENFVIMIDDFNVPGDDGYGYDNYGKRKVLSLDMISEIMSKHDLVSFFPSIASGHETGFKRGCVILARKGGFSEGLDNIRSLCKKDF